MPTNSNPESRCPFCRCSYCYSIAFENNISTKHTDLAVLFFVEEVPDKPLDGAEHLPYINDKEHDSDGKRFEFLDDEKDENVQHGKGPFIPTFVDVGRPTGDGRHYRGHLQSRIKHPIEPFNDVYDFCLTNWLINSKLSLININEFFSSGLYISDGGSFKRAKTSHAVINYLPTTLGQPS